MKRFILAAIVAVIGFVSCEKDNANSIVGTWEAASVQMEMEGMDMTVDLKQMGVNMEITFEKNGTAKVTESMEGESYTETFDYTYSGGMLTITSEGESISIPATISGNVLTLTADGDLLDEEEFYGTVRINFERK